MTEEQNKIIVKKRYVHLELSEEARKDIICTLKTLEWIKKKLQELLK